MIDVEASFTYWRSLVAGVELPTLTERLEQLRPSWMRYGACRGNGIRAYFPDRGVSAARAKAVCGLCTVRAECLAYALADPDLQGVWGGTSDVERRALRRAA